MTHAISVTGNLLVTFFLFWSSRWCFGEGNGTPLQYSCLENPMDGGAWWATVHGVTKCPTRLSDFTFTFHFHALEKEMATHSSVLAWRIPGMGEPDGLLSMGSHRVGHDWSDLAAAAVGYNTDGSDKLEEKSAFISCSGYWRRGEENSIWKSFKGSSELKENIRFWTRLKGDSSVLGTG